MTAAIQTTLRTQLCQALIAAGKTDATSIIGEVTALEQFIYGDVRNAEVNTVIDQTAKAEAKKAVTKAVEETAQISEEQPAQARDEIQDPEKTSEISVSFDEVKSALMQVAKRNRDKLIEILGKFGTDKVNALKEADYSAVLKLADEFLGVANA